MYLSNLLQNIYSDLGQTPANYGNFLATGGGATTFINTDWGDLESPPETDAFKNMIMFVVRDAAGAGALPENKYARITAYNDATYTGTFATITDAIGIGDSIMIAKQDLFPLQEVVVRVNRALSNLGDIPLIDTSLTTVGEEWYDVPVNLKRRPPREIWYGDDDTGWTLASMWKFEPALPGSTGKLFIPNTPSGFGIKIVYDGVHPVVSAYNSVISETIHPEVITTKATLEILSWYNRRDENQGSNEYFLWLEGEYRDKYMPLALMKNPITRQAKAPRYAIFPQPIRDGELDAKNTGGGKY